MTIVAHTQANTISNTSVFILLKNSHWKLSNKHHMKCRKVIKKDNREESNIILLILSFQMFTFQRLILFISPNPFRWTPKTGKKVHCKLRFKTMFAVVVSKESTEFNNVRIPIKNSFGFLSEMRKKANMKTMKNSVLRIQTFNYRWVCSNSNSRDILLPKTRNILR